jgi:DNA-binding transcriptional MerR regulator
MFKIADFSRFTRVSVKMLRHYDELGLLRPAHVDPDSGYRSYTADQLPRLNRVIALKDLGFGLEQIRGLLDDHIPAEELRGMLRLRRAELAAQIAEARHRLAQVEERLQQITHETDPPRYDVVFRPVPAQLVASLRAVVPDDGPAIAALFAELELHVASQRLRAAATPLTLFHDPEYRDQELDVEVAVPTLRPVEPRGRVEARELPSEPLVACAVFTGGYERTDEVLQAILRAIAASGYSVAGPWREVYLRFHPGDAERLGVPPAFVADRPELFVTEVQVPVAAEPRAAAVQA